MLKKIINQGRSRLILLDEHTLEVMKKSSLSIIVKVIGMAVGLGVSIFLARTIGAKGLGIINLTNRVVNILLIVGLFGMPQVIIKGIAIAFQRKDWNHIGQVMHTVYWLNGLLTLTISILLILISPIIASKIFHEPQLTFPLIIAFSVMTPQVFSRLFSSALIGYRKIWQSNLVDQTLSICLVGILLSIFSLFNFTITINRVAIFYASGRILVTLTMTIYWKRIFNHNINGFYSIKKLLKPGIPILFSSISFILSSNSDLILIGYFENSTIVGLYAVASRLALLTSFFLQVVNSALSPKIAYLYKNNSIKELEKMLQRTTKTLIILGLLILIIFVFFGQSLLSIWGDQFKIVYSILIILSIGQFINLSTSSLSQILIMTGHEKTQAKIASAFMLLNIFLNILFISKWGIIGAAIATSISVSGENIFKYFVVRLKLNLKIINL